MFTDLDRAAVDQHALRLGFGAPLAFLPAALLDAPMAFIAPVLFVTLASGMRTPPKPKMVAVIAAAIFLLPRIISNLAGVVVEYPYLLLGLVALMLFHGMRLQAQAATRPLGALLTSFGVMFPLVTDTSRQAGALLGDVLLYNGGCALAALIATFVLFPHPAGGKATTGAPVAPDAADATRHGLVGAAVMTPLVAFFLTLDLVTAMRVLFVAAAVAAAATASETRRQSLIAFTGLALGGVVALAVSLLAGVWRTPFGGFLLMVIASLLVARRAVEGPSSPFYVSGLTAAWVLVVTTGAEPAQKVALFVGYAAAGVGWALGARSLLAGFFTRAPRASSA